MYIIVNNWLFNSTSSQWTLSPNSSNANNVFFIYSGGYVYYNNASGTFCVRPALFLKSDVVIAEGTGTESAPYTIE